MIRKSLYALAVATGAMAFASQADAAVQFIFYQGGGNTIAGGQTDLPSVAPTGVLCSAPDRCGTTLTYSKGGFTPVFSGTTLEADPPGGNVVTPEIWADYRPDYGGIGIGKTGSTENIWIGDSDTVTATFSKQVTITGLELFNHGDPLIPTGSFNVTVDNATTFIIAFGNPPVLPGGGLTGTTFKFEEDGGNAISSGKFYISSMTVVPIPAALPLFATALAGLGLFGWRKRKAGTA